MLSRFQRVQKRIFDLVLSIVLLPFLILPIFLLYIFGTIHFKKSGMFVQERVGQAGRMFRLFKLRSLTGTGHKNMYEINQDATSFGRFLRTSRLDELPQIFNVLIGDMSLVGPRPDVAGYADILTGSDRVILTVKPGITGPATLKYKDEDQLLCLAEDPNVYNDIVIWPDKVKINKEYITNWNLWNDVKYLFKSLAI